MIAYKYQGTPGQRLAELFNRLAIHTRIACQCQHRLILGTEKREGARIVQNLGKFGAATHAHLKLIGLLTIEDDARDRLRQTRAERRNLFLSPWPIAGG